MDWKNLVLTVLTIVVAAILKFVFAYLKVPIDETTFNSIVAAIVTLLIALIFTNTGEMQIKAYNARQVKAAKPEKPAKSE